MIEIALFTPWHFLSTFAAAATAIRYRKSLPNLLLSLLNVDNTKEKREDVVRPVSLSTIVIITFPSAGAAGPF
jgi:hypothetical protein